MTPEFKLVERLKKQELTLALAESCTGGMIAQHVTNVAGASTSFLGGIVCYANAVKHDFLNVPQETLDTYGAVSHETAILLAENVRALFHSDLSAAVTGVAGPDGGTVDKPVGLVYIAVLGPRGLVVRRYLFSGDRQCIRRQACATTLSMLIEQT